MDEELEDGIVFRLATLNDEFPPGSRQLTPAHFELSTKDKEDARGKGHEPRLSVYDAGRCTVDQARSLRAVSREYSAFGLEVPEIRSIRVAGLDPLRVVRDQLEPPLRDMPGADGHCGIIGLARKPGQQSMLYRELRVRLADRSFPYPRHEADLEPSTASEPAPPSSPESSGSRSASK